MKKKNYITILLSLGLALGITACGDNKSFADLQKENNPSTMTISNKELEKESKEDIEQEIKEDTDTEKDTDTQEKENTVVYQHKDIYMSIELPREWDYEIQTVKKMQEQDDLALCAIDFWLKENPDLKLQLSYCPAFGMCGTGVTIEKITLDNDLSAWKYTETIDNIVWFTLVYELEPENGYFVVKGDMKEELWSEYETEIIKLLGTVSLKKSEDN